MHGITGLVTGTSLLIELPRPFDVVDVGIAHLGEPPSVVAFVGGKEVARVSAEPRQRHVENLRLVGSDIDTLTITTSDGQAVVNYLRTQPKPARRPRKQRNRPAPSSSRKRR